MADYNILSKETFLRLLKFTANNYHSAEDYRRLIDHDEAMREEIDYLKQQLICKSLLV